MGTVATPGNAFICLRGLIERLNLAARVKSAGVVRMMGINR